MTKLERLLNLRAEVKEHITELEKVGWKTCSDHEELLVHYRELLKDIDDALSVTQ